MSAYLFVKENLRAALLCARSLAIDWSSVVIAHEGQLIVATPDDELPEGVNVELHFFDGEIFHHADRRVIAAFQYGCPTYYTTSLDIAHEQAAKRFRESRYGEVVIFNYGRIAVWDDDCTLAQPVLFAVVDSTDSLLNEIEPEQIIARYERGKMRPSLRLVTDPSEDATEEAKDPAPDEPEPN